MSERNRAGLIGLKRPLVQPDPPVIPMERLEDRMLSPATTAEAPAAMPEAVQPEIVSSIPQTVLSTVQSEILPETLRKRKAREPLTAWTLKLPLSLHRELKQVAQYNDIGMTAIVIDALRQYLPEFPHPDPKDPVRPA